MMLVGGFAYMYTTLEDKFKFVKIIRISISYISYMFS